MKPVVIIAIAFVLLLPGTVFAQESRTCPPGSYHGLDNSGNDACRDIETNKIIKTQTNIISDTPSNPSDNNPFSILINFFQNLFKGFSQDSIEKSVNSLEKSIESVSDSVPIDLESISGDSEIKLEDCSVYKENRFSDKELMKLSKDEAGNTIGDMFVAHAKMKACEQRNKQLIKSQLPQVELSPSEKDALWSDWKQNRFSEKYQKMEMDCYNHPFNPGYLVFDPNKIEQAIFERCILP